MFLIIFYTETLLCGEESALEVLSDCVQVDFYVSTKISIYLKCENTFVILCILVSYWYQTYLKFMKVYKYFVFNNEIFWFGQNTRE